MELTIHQQVLASAVVIGLVIGGVSSKTNFCTLGAVSDWVNMGDTARMRAWLLAISCPKMEMNSAGEIALLERDA